MSGDEYVKLLIGSLGMSRRDCRMQLGMHDGSGDAVYLNRRVSPSQGSLIT
jgi:hypothetical protein